MTLEEFARWGNNVGGVVIIVCLVITFIQSKRMGKDERAHLLYYKAYSVMFYIFGGLLLASMYFGLGDHLTGKGYQNLIIFMCATSFTVGTIFLLILERKY